MASKRTILGYSKESERDGGRWLLEHDGPDERPGFQPGGGLVTSTGRIGHIHELQYDMASRSYATENKRVLLNKTWEKWWLKVIARAMDAGKQPLLRIDPSNRPVRIPEMHVITKERHAQLLAAEREHAALNRWLAVAEGMLQDMPVGLCEIGYHRYCDPEDCSLEWDEPEYPDHG